MNTPQRRSSMFSSRQIFFYARIVEFEFSNLEPPGKFQSFERVKKKSSSTSDFVGLIIRIGLSARHQPTTSIDQTIKIIFFFLFMESTLGLSIKPKSTVQYI